MLASPVFQGLGAGQYLNLPAKRLDRIDPAGLEWRPRRGHCVSRKSRRWLAAGQKRQNRRFRKRQPTCPPNGSWPSGARSIETRAANLPDHRAVWPPLDVSTDTDRRGIACSTPCASRWFYRCAGAICIDAGCLSVAAVSCAWRCSVEPSLPQWEYERVESQSSRQQAVSIIVATGPGDVRWSAIGGKLHEKHDEPHTASVLRRIGCGDGRDERLQ